MYGYYMDPFQFQKSQAAPTQQVASSKRQRPSTKQQAERSRLHHVIWAAKSHGKSVKGKGNSRKSRAGAPFPSHTEKRIWVPLTHPR